MCIFKEREREREKKINKLNKYIRKSLQILRSSLHGGRIATIHTAKVGVGRAGLACSAHPTENPATRC